VRARRLVYADLQDLALLELRWGIRQYPDSEIALRYIMSRVYENRGDYYESIVSLRRAFPDYFGRPIDSLPDQVWRLLFPVRHWEIVSEQAAKAEVDPLLILGLIRQESAFEERAFSSAGARGLMQIIPATGRMLATQARISRYNSGELFQAETNITLGIRHLAVLLQKYEKIEVALSAYNAGETRAKKWIQEFGDTDMAEFVEQIPFSETRNYVKRVLGNKAYYDLLLSSPKSSIPAMK
jgi:soluble lytic murein transglycosylase